MSIDAPHYIIKTVTQIRTLNFLYNNLIHPYTQILSYLNWNNTLVKDGNLNSYLLTLVYRNNFSLPLPKDWLVELYNMLDQETLL